VPVDGQDWASDPFAASERDGRIHGRGACDMKSFLAAVLAAVPRFRARTLATPVHLAFSYDEEVGCLGVRPLIDHIVRHLPRPRAVIIGEPTGMAVVDAHKGAESFVTEIAGRAAHASTPQLGADAILAAGRLLGEIDRIARDLAARGDPSQRFDPPATTVQVGLIQGGAALNIVPERCTLRWQTRLLPDADPDEVPERLRRFAAGVERNLQAVAPEARIATERTNRFPGLAPDPGSPATALALALADAKETHAVSYGTEAGLYQRAGIPAVVCGPGDIAQAHTANEFITLDQVSRCEAFLQRLADRLSA